MDIHEVAERLEEFAAEGEWEQFHTPKNLAMALAAETGELVEVFQWLTPQESKAVMSSDSAQHVSEEIADILIYTIRLADVLDIDLEGSQREARLRADPDTHRHAYRQGDVERPSLGRLHHRWRLGRGR